MVGYLFDGFDLCGIFDAKVSGHFPDPLAFSHAQREDSFLAQGDKIFGFNINPVFDQGVFGEVIAQGGKLGLVAPIDRGNSAQGMKCRHEKYLGRKVNQSAVMHLYLSSNMQKKIRVGAVSYLNTKPLIYGFGQGPIQQQVELTLDYPARLAGMMQEGKLDIALLPVASIPSIEGATVFSRYCIASDRQVASVCLFSEVPIEEIQELYLDYQSRTSVALFRILMRDYWKVRPMLLQANEDYIDDIREKRAGIIIGDRALQYYERFPYRYDLAEAWHAHTGLPFVFATWVSNTPLSPEFIAAFNEANALGLDQLDTIIASSTLDHYNLATYFRENIGYELTEERRKGMQLFLKGLEKLV